MTLSDSLPMLEHMGLRVLDERPYRIDAARAAAGLDARLRPAAAPRDADVEIDALRRGVRGRVRRASSAARSRTTTSTGWCVAARLPADEIVVLRAYAKYLRQIGFPLSQAFIEPTLAAHPAIARMLVELFRLRFDPDEGAMTSGDASRR